MVFLVTGIFASNIIGLDKSGHQVNSFLLLDKNIYVGTH